VGDAAESLAQRLRDGILVLDGGTGTQLYESGIPFTACFEAVNVDKPELVTGIHRAFLEAGADAVQTNTFGANRFRLAKHGMAGRVAEFAAAGGRAARAAAADGAWVLGSIGPLGVELEPIGRLEAAEAREAFAEAAAALEPHVDGWALETFTSLPELLAALSAVQAVSDKPVLAMLSVSDTGYTTHGDSAADAAAVLEDAGADAIGFNCSSGPNAVLAAALQALEVVEVPVIAKPNAGIPRQVDGRLLYQNDPDYFARSARRFLQAGGRIIGGCCGTTPEHVQAIVRAARMGRAQAAPHTADRPRLHRREEAPRQVAPLGERSALGRALAAGSCPVSVELVPPRTPDMSRLLEAARALKDAGADAVNLPDGPRASARISNTATAAILERETGIETLPHFCCRDRNLLGMQSDLLGCSALGLHNLLLITGDPPYQGNYPDVTAVFDVDSIGLCNIVDQLNHGLDIGGNAMDAQTSFCFGAAFNHTAVDLARELERFHWKRRAGVDFFITQPVFDAEALLAALTAAGDERPPVLAGIWPLRSLRNAEFLHSEVPGVVVPDAVLERMQQADLRGRAAEEGIAIACEIVTTLAGRVEGFQVAAPFNRVEPALQVLDAIHAAG